jgi:hypothetical protein
MFTLSDLSLYSRTMLGFCAALLLVLIVEVSLLGFDTNNMSNASELASSAEAASTLTAATLQITPLAAYREVRERPLFSDSRRPPEKAAQAPAATRAVQLDTKWKVTGIVVAGESSFVHVEGLRDRKTVRLQVGMPLDGWKLQEIAPNEIVFGLGGDSVTLQLHKDPAESAK